MQNRIVKQKWNYEATWNRNENAELRMEAENKNGNGNGNRKQITEDELETKMELQTEMNSKMQNRTPKTLHVNSAL